jgi:polyhydroxybutyrate depolymerase
LLAHLKKHHKVDEKRIFVAGFSNGGNFTYLLWATRGDVLAAVAPCAGVAQDLKGLRAKPCLHIVGKKDGRMDHLDHVIEVLCKVNGCASEGKPWAKDSKLTALLYPSKSGTPLVSVVHPGGHEVPDEAGRLIVRFFKGNGDE